MPLPVNIGPRQRRLRVGLGIALLAVAWLPAFGPISRIVIGLVGLGAIASGGTGF